MREIYLEAKGGNVFKIITVEGDEVVKITYSKAVDDIMIATEGGDVLLRWDVHDWNDDECMLIREKDNLKEIGKISCNILLLKSKNGDRVKIYTVAQIN